MKTDHQSNPALARLRALPIEREDAKRVIAARHYMRTFPQGAKVCFGLFDSETNKLVGVLVYGYSSATDAKVVRVLGETLPRDQYIEMQRMWISDAYGHNSESFFLSRTLRQLKSIGVRLVITHAGGCKNDCGIVYQASNWLYFGSEPCSDFFFTDTGEYKNIIAAMRFGRVKTKGKTHQQIGEECFGPGRIVEANRYLYAFPTDRHLRPKLEANAQAYPKDSTHFRRDQEWVS